MSNIYGEELFSQQNSIMDVSQFFNASLDLWAEIDVNQFNI